MTLYPVILAGGCGTRLWPMSRESYPKQFLPLLEGRSPFQATLARCLAMGKIEAPTVIANQEHRFLVADQAKAEQHVLRKTYLEPFGRSTAPALGVVAYEIYQEDPTALLLVLPADHDIPDEAQFAEAVAMGEAAARQGHLVVLGVEPRWPET